MSAHDREILDGLADALAPPRSGPSEDRVAAVRAHATARRSHPGGPPIEEPPAPAPAPPASKPDAAPAPVELAGRRRRRELLTGAVAAATGAALGVIGWESLDEDARPGPPTEPVEVAVERSGVAAEAVLIDHTWGVEIILTATGLPASGVYRAAVQPAATGADVSAGSFLGVDGVTIVCRMNASILRSAARSFTVIDAAGERVMTGTFA